MALPSGTTILRDFYAPGRLARFTALRDHHGPDATPHGPFYRLGARVVAANSRMVDVLFGVPDQLRDDWALMADRRQRRFLARALVNERYMSPRRRRALMSILLWSMLVLWAVTGAIIAVVSRDALEVYKAGYALFFYSLATSVFLPTPFELLLQESVETLGFLATVLVAAVAKTVGAWLVLLLGDKANQGLDQVLGKRGLMARAFRWTQAFAQKYGYFAIFVLFAIPFMSDTLPLFVLAVMRMKKLPFLAVTFAAIAVRSVIYLAAGDAIAVLTGT